MQRATVADYMKPIDQGHTAEHMKSEHSFPLSPLFTKQQNCIRVQFESILQTTNFNLLK